MRSGPSTRTTACVARRQVKRCGGPSGTVANGTLIGSGLSNSRSGRNGHSGAFRQGGKGRTNFEVADDEVHAGVNGILIYIIPFLEGGNGYFVVVDADAVHPFLLLCDIDDGDEAFGGEFLAGL